MSYGSKRGPIFEAHFRRLWAIQPELPRQEIVNALEALGWPDLTTKHLQNYARRFNLPRRRYNTPEVTNRADPLFDLPWDPIAAGLLNTGCPV